jgi:hypothetical protein
MPELVKNFCELFADDSKLIAIIRSIRDREILQDDVDKLLKWTNVWEMCFNNDKCKIMTIQSGMSKRVQEIKNNSQKITMIDSNGIRGDLIETSIERDLGVHLNNKLKWSDQITIATNRAYSVLGMLKRTFKHWNIYAFVKLYIDLI